MMSTSAIVMSPGEQLVVTAYQLVAHTGDTPGQGEAPVMAQPLSVLYAPPTPPAVTFVDTPNRLLTQDVGIGGVIRDVNGNSWCTNTLLLSLTSQTEAALSIFTVLQSLTASINTLMGTLNSTANAMLTRLTSIDNKLTTTNNLLTSGNINTGNVVVPIQTINTNMASVATSSGTTAIVLGGWDRLLGPGNKACKITP